MTKHTRNYRRCKKTHTHMCAWRPVHEPTPAGLKLHRAVTEADGAKLRSLMMENNEAVDELDEAGMTPFRRAVRMKDCLLYTSPSPRDS